MVFVNQYRGHETQVLAKHLVIGDLCHWSRAKFFIVGLSSICSLHWFKALVFSLISFKPLGKQVVDD